jgi:hypothetical protein
LQHNAISANSPPSLGWYAGIGLLCLLPIMFFMLFLDEQQFILWLPLIALVKAIGIPGCMVYIGRTLPQAISFGMSSNYALMLAVFSAAFFILADILIGLFCFGRSRALCK